LLRTGSSYLPATTPTHLAQISQHWLDSPYIPPTWHIHFNNSYPFLPDLHHSHLPGPKSHSSASPTKIMAILFSKTYIPFICQSPPQQWLSSSARPISELSVNPPNHGYPLLPAPYPIYLPIPPQLGYPLLPAPYPIYLPATPQQWLSSSARPISELSVNPPNHGYPLLPVPNPIYLPIPPQLGYPLLPAPYPIYLPIPQLWLYSSASLIYNLSASPLTIGLSSSASPISHLSASPPTMAILFCQPHIPFICQSPNHGYTLLPASYPIYLPAPSQ
jgi:hypothetical protein